MTPAGFRAFIARYGSPVQWRVRTGTGPQQSPPNIPGAVTVSSAAVSGAATISVRAPYAAGRLVAGDILTIAGSDHAVTSSVSAASNVFANVPISPALPANVATGTAVTLTFSADHDVSAVVKEFAAHELAGGIEAGDLSVVIAADGLGFAPATGQTVAIDGVEFRVLSPSRKQWGGRVLGWRVVARK